MGSFHYFRPEPVKMKTTTQTASSSRREDSMTKPRKGKIRVLAGEVEFYGNPTPEMVDQMQKILEDFALGKTTPERMAAEFEESERRKIN